MTQEEYEETQCLLNTHPDKTTTTTTTPPMKTYTVTACYTVYLTAEVEAVDANDAWLKARELDGGDFVEQSTDGWFITDIKPTTE